jgi:hypothetical protein
MVLGYRKRADGTLPLAFSNCYELRRDELRTVKLQFFEQLSHRGERETLGKQRGGRFGFFI